MSVLVVYRQASEYTRVVEEYMHDFQRRTSRTLEVVDPDSPQGADLCRLYDIVEYPTLIAISKDSQLLHMWRGVPLPLIDEVSYYVE